MNFIDIIIGLLLVWAVIDGLRKGIVTQLGGILSVFLGIYLAYLFSRPLSVAVGLGTEVGRYIAFVVILLGCIIIAVMISKLLSKLFDMIGLGIMDKIGGVILSLIKMVIIISALEWGFDYINDEYQFVKKETLDESRFYYPTKKVAVKIFPFLNKMVKTATESIQ